MGSITTAIFNLFLRIFVRPKKDVDKPLYPPESYNPIPPPQEKKSEVETKIKPMEEIKTMSEFGIKFLMNNEGFKLKPYLDTKGIPTIGVGCTYYEDNTKVKMSDPPLTEKRAIELFRFVLKHYELSVYSNTRDDINQNQFDALVSMCFNIGVNGFKNSTLVERINARASDSRIEDAFMMWRKPKEIIARRRREVALYFKPI